MAHASSYYVIISRPYIYIIPTGTLSPIETRFPDWGLDSPDHDSKCSQV